MCKRVGELFGEIVEFADIGTLIVVKMLERDVCASGVCGGGAGAAGRSWWWTSAVGRDIFFKQRCHK